jgi:hypothetical protein
MKPITIVIVEDSEEFAVALKQTLEEQKKFPCTVVVLDPNRPEPPTFEQFHDEIQSHLRGFADIVLMDNHLGKWKWKGAHLAPSFPHNLISTSTDPAPWAKYSFTRKTDIAFHHKAEAQAELIESIVKVWKDTMPDEFILELFPPEPFPSVIKVNGVYSLEQLERSGCQLAYGRAACGFSESPDYKGPTEVHFFPLPDAWDCDVVGWAPPGFRALGLSILVAIGIEHPELQEKLQITATRATDGGSLVSFPTYAYLGMREGKRVLTIDGCGFVPFCLRDKKGHDQFTNLVVAFEKIA